MGSQIGLKPFLNHIETLIQTLKLTNFQYVRHSQCFLQPFETLFQLSGGICIYLKGCSAF